MISIILHFLKSLKVVVLCFYCFSGDFVLVFVVSVVIVAGFEKTLHVHLMTSLVPLARGVSKRLKQRLFKIISF